MKKSNERNQKSMKETKKAMKETMTKGTKDQ